MTTVTASDTYSHTVFQLLDDPSIDTPWNRIIDSQDEWEAFFNEPLAYMTFSVDADIPTAAVIDFNQYQIVTGGLGIQETGGYRLLVEEVEDMDNEIVIHTLMIKPSTACGIPIPTSYPSATILVERTDKPFRFSLSQLIDECL